MAIFTNQATLTFNGVSVNSNIVTGEITQVITAWKRSASDGYRQGDILTYVINLQNSGTTDFTGLTVTDDLGAYAFGTGTGTVTPLTYTGDPVIYSVNGVLQTSPTVTAGPPMVISGITVPAGGNTNLTYRVRVNEFAPVSTDTTIQNTATVSGTGLTEAVIAADTVTADNAARLSIFKELSPSTIPENGELTYTFLLQNSGNTATEATDVLTVTDTFNPILEAPLTVTLNGAPLAEGTGYTYNETTGLFSTVAGAIEVPAATATQDPTTGAFTVTPGTATLTVTGRV